MPFLHAYMVGRRLDPGARNAGMSDMTTSMIRSRPVAAAAIAIAVVGAATILGAWVFQYGLGLKPCPLCLEQRYAYYFAIPLAAMVALGDHAGASRKVLIAALVAIALGMLWNTGLGVYHSGVEWKWWAGPQTCGGAPDALGSGRRTFEAARDHQRGALRRGGLALPRPLARRLQRADLAAARRHRGVGGGLGVARARECPAIRRGAIASTTLRIYMLTTSRARAILVVTSLERRC